MIVHTTDEGTPGKKKICPWENTVPSWQPTYHRFIRKNFIIVTKKKMMRQVKQAMQV